MELWQRMKNNNYMIANCTRKTPVAPENETQIVQLLLKNGLFLQREVNQVFRRFGLKQQQFSVLDGIVWHGPINQKDLSETLLFEKSNISKIVRILTEKNDQCRDEPDRSASDPSLRNAQRLFSLEGLHAGFY
jgi:hypothetical protein